MPTWRHFEKFTQVARRSGTSSGASCKQTPYQGGFALAVAMRQKFPNEFIVLLGCSRGAWWAALWAAADPRAKVFDRIISCAGYSSPCGSQEVQRLDCYSAAAAYSVRLLMLGSYNDHCCNVRTCNGLLTQLKEHCAVTGINNVLEHSDYDFFSEGVLRCTHDDEDEDSAAVLHRVLDNGSDVCRVC